MPIPLTFSNMSTPPTAEAWGNFELTIANTLGLPTTTWQPGGIERTVFAVNANMQQQSDISGAIVFQAGFLDFAATGTVTYTDLDGAVVTLYVTPDPSIPAQNPDGTLGWLDVLADSVYDVQRIITSYAGGSLAILNLSGSTYGSFSPGTYHVLQLTETAAYSYSNTAALTIPTSSGIGSVTDVTDASGIVQVEVIGHGLTTGAYVFIYDVAGATEANGAWVVTVTGGDTFTLNGSTYGGAYTSGGEVASPTVATFTADVSGSASDAAPNTVDRSVTSLIGVSVSNVTSWLGTDTEGNVALAARCRLKLQSLSVGAVDGAYVYYALVAQILAPTLSPAQHVGAAITRALVTLDTTTGTSHITIANNNGAPSSGDVEVVQAVENAYAGVMTSTAIVQAAVENEVLFAITIYLPSAYNTTANKTYFETAVNRYIRTLAIGGVTNPGGAAPNTNVVPYDSVMASVYTAAQLASIPIQDIDGTLNGATLNIQLAMTPIPEVAVPDGSSSITLVDV